MSGYPLRLEEYYFPIQEVTANPAFNPAGNRNGSHTRQQISVTRQHDDGAKWLIDLLVELEQDASDNPAYFFRIQAFGVLAAEPDTAEETAEQLVSTAGAQLLIGAVRERLATLTARAPWGQFFLGIVPINVAPAKI